MTQDQPRTPRWGSEQPPRPGPHHKEYTRNEWSHWVTVTVVLTTQCGVSSWLWSDGGAGRWWLQGPAVQHPQRSIFIFSLRVGWDVLGQDRMGLSSLPSQGGPACPHPNVPHSSCPSHSSLLLAVK